MRCPGCEGMGCERCIEGQIDVTECPLKVITGDVRQVIILSELFEKGLPPVAGGTLNQAKIFVDAAQYTWGEKQYWKEKLGALD